MKKGPAPQFVRRMGVVTSKPMVMFRPTELEVATALPAAQTAGYMPATVVDRIDMYFIIKYFLRFEDGLARFPPKPCHASGPE